MGPYSRELCQNDMIREDDHLEFHRLFDSRYGTDDSSYEDYVLSSPSPLAPWLRPYNSEVGGFGIVPPLLVPTTTNDKMATLL